MDTMVCDISLSEFETHAYEILQFFPLIWFFYVDDLFAVFYRNQYLQSFIEKFNSFYATVKLTSETEKNY